MNCFLNIIIPKYAGHHNYKNITQTYTQKPYAYYSGGGKGETIIYSFKVCFSCPRYATNLLVPDSEGNNPKRNENNRCGVTQQQNALLSNDAVLSIMVQKQYGCISLGVNGSLT